LAVVRDAAAGVRAAGRGATALLLRDPAATARTLQREATRLVASAEAPVVVSARADLALAVGAAGVHLPERDLPAAAARRLLPDRLVGRSVHSVGEAVRSEQEGADYVVFGPVYESRSHPGQPARGLGPLREVVRAVRVPVLAIGGVDAARARECREAGAAGFAAIGYFEEMVTLRVNGRTVELEAPTPLLDYVAGLGVDPRAIAVEVNGEILERDDYGGCTLGDGDVVEIVRMVGGGAGGRRP
jgi:thiamine-phosphate pyrophosphorylase